MSFIYQSVALSFFLWGLWQLCRLCLSHYRHVQFMRRYDQYHRWMLHVRRTWKFTKREDQDAYRHHLLAVMKGKNKEMRGPWEEL